ncbi:hypothetical protein [Massilia sp. TS11]|uniref:hypothetical protein n=1 Tax=Massilia sp. TS11 TaxID=2908003 RepID=UPI001EDBEE59|nr:hypothetical protein [Massilia sp. TS11]MCG2585294.1 hypothetical protein [Massilia sp. TS11]
MRIDDVLQVDIPDDLSNPLRQEFHNHLGTLQSMACGLAQIYDSVKAEELKEQEELKSYGKGVSVFKAFNDKLFLIEPRFHWYAVALMNFIRLNGVLCGLVKRDLSLSNLSGDPAAFKDYSLKYSDSVLNGSAIKEWRNKISAHHALIDPKPSDVALIEALLIPCKLVLGENRYRLGGFETNGKNLPEWSLTEVHEDLRSRRFGGYF